MKNSLKAAGRVFFSMCLGYFAGFYTSGNISYFLFGEPDFPEPDKE